MKKFIMMLLGLVLTLSVNAQPIEQNKFFDQTYVGVTVGYDSNAHPWRETGMVSGLRVGKFLTPQVGVELEGTAQFEDFYKRIVNHRVGANALLNLNYLGGYSGKRNVVEVMPFVGAGWQRNYANYTNALYTKMGVYVNFNINDALYLSLVPSIAYVLSPQMQYNINKADVGLCLGLTYRFKNSMGTRNFVLSDKVYTQAQYDELNSTVNELRSLNRALSIENEALASRPATVQVPVTHVHTVEVPVFATVGFENGSEDIAPTYKLNIKSIAEYMMAEGGTYVVTGYASENGPEDYNQELSVRRAQSVKDALVAEGVHEDQIEVVGEGETTEFGEDLDLNRTVVIVRK